MSYIIIIEIFNLVISMNKIEKMSDKDLVKRQESTFEVKQENNK